LQTTLKIIIKKKIISSLKDVKNTTYFINDIHYNMKSFFPASLFVQSFLPTLAYWIMNSENEIGIPKPNATTFLL
jgi:hypothetical protein